LKIQGRGGGKQKASIPYWLAQRRVTEELRRENGENLFDFY
jgi:hypothetical protein